MKKTNMAIAKIKINMSIRSKMSTKVRMSGKDKLEHNHHNGD